MYLQLIILNLEFIPEMAVYISCKVIKKKYEVLCFMEYSAIIDLIGRLQRALVKHSPSLHKQIHCL